MTKKFEHPQSPRVGPEDTDRGCRPEAEEEALFRAKAQRGLDDIAAGRVHTAEEINAEAKSWRTKIRRRLGDRA